MECDYAVWVSPPALASHIRQGRLGHRVDIRRATERNGQPSRVYSRLD
jgi:hypothetical protein